MQVSLNDLVHMLADRCGHTFDIPVQEELKVILNVKRAYYIRQLLEREPNRRKYYLTDISVELERVDKAECPVEVDCTVLRTTATIPTPLSTSYTMFDFVGTPDRFEGFSYVTPDQLTYIIPYGSKYTQDNPRYFYVNNYIYIYNEDDLEYINIRAVWTDTTQLSGFRCDDNETPCYTDDTQWDIPEDLIKIVLQDTIDKELKLFLPKELDTEVTVDNKTTNQ